jgi:hypothetical protein
MTIFTVEFITLSGDRNTTTVRVRAHNERDAIARAVTKQYGPRAWFFRDRGLPIGNYGQVMESIPRTSTSTSRTGRIRIDVDSNA